MKDNGEFTCVVCQRTFKRTRSYDEAFAEAMTKPAQRPDHPDEPVYEVCDDCYQQAERRRLAAQ